MVTASGSPSGTATTTIVTATTSASITACRCAHTHGFCATSATQYTISTTNTAMATPRPPQPMFFAILSSDSCRGVGSRGKLASLSMVPHSESSPTAVTSMVPMPASVLQPHSMNPDTVPGGFLAESDSPVIVDSSAVSSSPLISTPSPGTWSPVLSTTTSPTTTSSIS